MTAGRIRRAIETQLRSRPASSKRNRSRSESAREAAAVAPMGRGSENADRAAPASIRDTGAESWLAAGRVTVAGTRLWVNQFDPSRRAARAHAEIRQINPTALQIDRFISSGPSIGSLSVALSIFVQCLVTTASAL